MIAESLPRDAGSRAAWRVLGLSRWQRGTTLRVITLAVYTLLTVFPFYWMIITTFKQNSDLYSETNNPLWFNAPPTLDNVTYLLEQTRFLTWMWNSLVIGIGVVIITLITAVPAGYALARLRLPGAEKLGIAIFATYLVPPTLLFIPLTRVVHTLGLQNTIWSLVLVLPTISIPFSVWLLMGFFKNVSFEIEEAALVDGATRAQAVFHVILPISRAGLAASGMFAFAISLQAFLYPLVFTSSTAVKPVTLGVVTDLIRGDLFYWGSLMAGALLAGLPVAILFNYFLDDFVEGITAGSSK
ncbi:MAG: carbohydrate ABC transporter permease [Chloroflexi bacterium]|nr:carbohydrate ABC transporter permease [Chloroflexota bacterium]MBV9600802.1 carbohydrate ABC transporter permease [Chloroflexota bacterium]